MIFKRNILSKTLSNGLEATVSLMFDNGYFQSAVYVGGRRIAGPAMPVPLDIPKNGITHWLGDHPRVGLTAEEAKQIFNEVNAENSVVRHRKMASKYQ